MDDLVQLAELIRQSNAINSKIANLIRRPAEIGHLGEYIASRIFGIILSRSATQKSIDGYFTHGPLAGRSVNVKWYGKSEGMLDITPNTLPDFYLVLTGPKSTAITSRGTTRPRVIDYVYLFDAVKLYTALAARNVKIGVATSVIQDEWLKAEIYPVQRNPTFVLTDEQRMTLALFRSV